MSACEPAQLSLNDGFSQLDVEGLSVVNEVAWVVRVGGELRSRKGLDLPNIDLGIRGFTEHDRAKPGPFSCDETKRAAAAMSQAGLRHHHTRWPGLVQA
jgi:hypothetical protein